MDDLHSINDAINRRAGRKLGPSILVSLSLVAIVWASLAFEPIFFAALVTLAVC
jgi:phosphatidate cytidylyltransferase